MLITIVVKYLKINFNVSYHHSNVDNSAGKDKVLKFTRLVIELIFPNFLAFVFEKK